MPTLEIKVSQTRALLAKAATIGKVALASSLSAEDMVLTHLIAANNFPIKVFAIDTGMLHEETLELVEIAKAKYELDIAMYYPDFESVDDYITANGKHGFYESLDLRHSCCGIRKVEPLNRALHSLSGWITGQRRDQSTTRQELKAEQVDGARGIAKFNPLADWTWADVLEFVANQDVPINPLHARGYPSIGCAPCTRAVRPSENPRAGRWWWEQSDAKECGLHVKEAVS